jgi:acetylornithine deacetylase/succinyl-diaminopimelate desuccinylase-like protein
MNLEECFAFVDKNIENFVQILQSLIRIPSVSEDPDAPVRECGQALMKIMAERHIAVSMMELDGGWPLVYGTLHTSSKKNTLIEYGHYDVKPAGALSDWCVDPFAGKIINEVFVARGACDNKGGILSLVFAAEAILKTQDDFPINLTFIFDGEEELGSPHLAPWVEQNENLLTGDALLNMDKWGFNTLSVAGIGSREPPVTAELNNAFVHLVARAAKQVYGADPELNTWTADTFFGMGKMKQIPAAMTGFGVEEHNIHQPNEQLPLAFFITGIKYAITTFAYFAEWNPPKPD